MLYVAVRDGRTLRIDLGDEDDLSLWREVSSDPDSIRGVSLATSSARSDLPLPRRFSEVRYEVEVIRSDEGVVAERVSAVCDGVVCTLTMYTNGKSGRFRVDLDKRGRRRFRPS